MSTDNHREIREGDEYFCITCGKRWDIHEPAPECLTRRERGISEINKLRKQHGLSNRGQ